jgi:predicted permease
MAWHHEIRSVGRALFNKRQDEVEMDEELKFHVDMEAARHEREGLAPDEARRRAIRSFGGVERYKEEVRDQRGTRPLEDLLQDARFGWRALRRRPGFTVVAALTLALGIGATTTLFGVVKAALLTPLPWGDANRLVGIWSAWKGFDRTWISYDEYEGYKYDVKALSDVAAYSDGAVTLNDGTGEPERLRAGFVDRGIFRVLRVSPTLGRAFTAEEDRPNGPNVVILGNDVWQRRFGGDPAIIGKAIQIGGQATTVVGVMPASFRLPTDYGVAGATRLWFPLQTDATQSGGTIGPAFNPNGGNHGFYAVARLAPGATVDQANRQMAALIDRVTKDGSFQGPPQFRGFALAMDEQVMGRVKPVLLVVFAAVGLVLLIACANVAGLLLVRGEARRREMALRVALGVGTRRLVRLLLTESMVLAGVGMVLGVAFAAGGVWLVRHTAPAGLARVADTRLDPGVLLFALGAASLAAILSGLLPALQATRVAPAMELREGGRAATAGASRLRWRQTLVVAEVALAVVLVAGAGLMIRSVANLFAIDSGFRPDGVLTMRLSTPSTWYADSVKVEAFWGELRRRVAALPGVDAVGAARLLPLATEMGDWGLRVDGYTPPPNEGTPGDWQVVTPGYFEAMGLRLRGGRFFDARDDMHAPLAMIVNRTFVKKYFAGREPLGGRVRVGGSDSTQWYTVVGVVDDVHHNALTVDVKPQFYAPLGQFATAPGNTSRSMTLVVHTKGDPTALATPVRGIVHTIDARLPISDVRTMDEVLGASIAEPRFAMGLLALFGTLALVLSAIGIFGIVAQVVAARTYEFGIRAALGAVPGHLVGLGVRAGAAQAAVGLLIGTGLALALTRTMTAFLHGVAPTDPLTFAGVVLVTGGVALAASVLPARRAARADPASVLHEA